MKKKILLLIMAFFLLLPLNGSAVVDTFEGQSITDATSIEGCTTCDTIEGQIKKASSTCTDITLWINFDNCTSPCTGTYTIDSGNTEFSANDTSLVIYGDAVINTAAVKLGTNGLQMVNGSDYVALSNTSESILSMDQGRCGVWLYPTSINNYTTYIWVQNTGATQYFFLEAAYGDTQDLTFDGYSNSTNWVNLTTTGNITPTSTWKYVEIAWDQSENDRWIIVTDTGGSPTTFSDLTNAYADFDTNGTDNLTWGNNYATSSQLYMDQIICSTDPTRDIYSLGATTNSYSAACP